MWSTCPLTACLADPASLGAKSSRLSCAASTYHHRPIPRKRCGRRVVARLFARRGCVSAAALARWQVLAAGCASGQRLRRSQSGVRLLAGRSLRVSECRDLGVKPGDRCAPSCRRESVLGAFLMGDGVYVSFLPARTKRCPNRSGMPSVVRSPTPVRGSASYRLAGSILTHG